MSVTLQGLEYARVYDIRHDPPPAAYLNGDAGTTDWDGVIRLVAYELSMRGYAPGSSVALTTYVQVWDPESFNADHLSLLVRVVASNGTMISTASPKPLRQRQDRVIWPVVTRVRFRAMCSQVGTILKSQCNRNRRDCRWPGHFAGIRTRALPRSRRERLLCGIEPATTHCVAKGMTRRSRDRIRAARRSRSPEPKPRMVWLPLAATQPRGVPGRAGTGRAPLAKRQGQGWRSGHGS